jgi:hypothetical protein
VIRIGCISAFLHRARRPLAVGALAIAAAPQAAWAQTPGPTLDLRPGQEMTFAVTIVDSRVTLGPARVSKPGTAQPKEGEITIAVVKQGLSPYADLTVSEKTATPIDFVATGLIGNIKIDEVELCGRLDAPLSKHIGSASWRISLSRFAVHQSGPGCP